MNRLSKLSILFALTFIFLTSYTVGESSNTSVLHHTSKPVCKKTKPNIFSYKPIIAEPRIDHLQMIGKAGKYGVEGSNDNERLYGMVLRTLRFQNITRKVEKKYGIAQNLILAMIMQETGGVDVLTNGQNDGGVGLCHMQGSTSKEFGLKTYKGCDQLRCTKHGKALRKLVEKHNYDRKQLVKYDDRFQPILNIDAVGRMLSCYKYPKVKNFYMEWSSAIYRYAGRYNYRKYWRNVQYFKKILNDPKMIDKVRKEFNRRNTHLKINGKKSKFDDYIKMHQDQNINYGLNSY